MYGLLTRGQTLSRGLKSGAIVYIPLLQAAKLVIYNHVMIIYVLQAFIIL